MEREEFKTIVKGLKAVYAQPAFIPDADAFDVWYGMLRDLPYRQASLAVQQHMASSPYPQPYQTSAGCVQGRQRY